MREQYTKDMDKINEEILYYGIMAEKIVGMAIDSLINRDKDLALETIKFEREMDRFADELENRCIEMLALQQPVAKDLRTLASVIKIITDLERIGDLSENIAEITMKIADEEFIKPLIDIPNMANISKEMINKALNSYVNEDANQAYKVFMMDDIVDNIFKEVNTEVFYLVNKEMNFMFQGMQLLLVARYLERIADHATNICEGVNYIVNGVRKFKD